MGPVDVGRLDKRSLCLERSVVCVERGFDMPFERGFGRLKKSLVLLAA